MSTPLTKEMINKTFENEVHQANVMINLYKLAIPEWDNIKKLTGWPSINNNTWTYICQKFIEFDRKNHPDVMAGGCWMNSGFSIDNNLDDYEILPIDFDKIIYKNTRNKITIITIDNFHPTQSHELNKMIRFHRLLDNNHSYYHCTRTSYKRLARLLNNHDIVEYTPRPTFKGLWTTKG